MAAFQPAGAICRSLVMTLRRSSPMRSRSRSAAVWSSLRPSATMTSKSPGGGCCASSERTQGSMNLSSLRAATTAVTATCESVPNLEHNRGCEMKKAILVLAVLLGTVTNVEASTTSIHATPTSSVVGDKVTFKATFTSSCPGTLTTHYFTIDGKVYNGTVTQSGQAGSETLST